MKPTLVLLIGIVLFVGATGAVAADQSEPHWPDNETTTGNNETGVSPGQELAGVVGAQGASVQGELWNRTLSERLSNATTTTERAEIVSEEIELLETSIGVLEEARENLTESWEDDELSEGRYRASLSEFVVRARTVELRANRTVKAAEDLPASVRARRDINVSHVESLSDQAGDLYQFEDQIAREVANETLSNQSVERRVLGTENAE